MAAPRNNDAYVIGAAPITVNKTGNRDFCSTNDGVLRSQQGRAITRQHVSRMHRISGELNKQPDLISI